LSSAKSGSICFKAVLLQTGKTTTGIEVPSDQLAKLGAGARPAVLVHVNDYSYRTTVGAMGGRSLLPFSAEHREKSGLGGGDAIAVTIALDSEPRTVALPEDLEKALAAKRGPREAFAKLAPSRQKAEILNVTGAKSPETRARRLAAIVAKLTD